MTPEVIATQQALLNDWLVAVYGIHNDPFSKVNFPRILWERVSSLIHHNKENLLVQHAVKQYPDIIPRIFTILSIYYGSFTCEPCSRSLQVEMVGMLEKDLDKELVLAYEYGQHCAEGSFFPELVRVFGMIRDIYAVQHAEHEMLPPTAQHAFALFTLNNRELLDQPIPHVELLHQLSLLHQKIGAIITIVELSQMKEKPTLH